MNHLARMLIWKLRHPHWDYAADTTLRALGFNETDRHLLNASARKVFPSRDADTAAAGRALATLATTGAPAGDMVRHLRAARLLRSLSDRDLDWAVQRIAMVLAVGHLGPMSHSLLADRAPAVASRFSPEDVSAGRVTSEQFINTLTPKDATR